MLGDHEGFTAQNKHYFFVNVDEIEDHELTEMIKMGNHLTVNGDHEVATFVPTVHQTLTSFVEGQNCALFQFPEVVSRSKQQKSEGFQLAQFHQRGKTYPNSTKESGSWSQFWITRITQLEMVYADLSKQKKKNSFDQAFMVSFPYYLGRTENAIQYVVDTMLDFGEQSQNEPKTICHYQFTPNTWLTIDDRTQAATKKPLDFTYDYPSRDIAEWIRAVVSQDDKPIENITNFISEYEKLETISSFSWRSIYGRLLFPIDYYKIIEGYYRSVDIEDGDRFTEQLFDLFQSESQQEAFLRNFHRQIIPNHWQAYVPNVDWLKENSSQTLTNRI